MPAKDQSAAFDPDDTGVRSAASLRERPFFWRHVCPHFNWRYASCQNVEVCPWCGRTIYEEEASRRVVVR